MKRICRKIDWNCQKMYNYLIDFETRKKLVGQFGEAFAGKLNEVNWLKDEERITLW